MEFIVGGIRGYGKGRGRSVENVEVMEELQKVGSQVEAMRATRQRDPEGGDVSEPKQEFLVEEG